MAWETTNVMDQRKRFVLKALDPSSCMAELCREFGIPRKTGYKWVKRFQEGGYGGLEDLSRRPRGSPSRTPAEVQLEILKLRLRHQTWGPKKLRELLKKQFQRVPAASTIASVLAEAGVVQRRRSRRPRTSSSSERVTPEGPNDLWTVDFKGWWRTRDGKRRAPDDPQGVTFLTRCTIERPALLDRRKDLGHSCPSSRQVHCSKRSSSATCASASGG